MSEKEATDASKFIDMMLNSARTRKPTTPQSRTGSVSQKAAEDALKDINAKLKRK